MSWRLQDIERLHLGLLGAAVCVAALAGVRPAASLLLGGAVMAANVRITGLPITLVGALSNLAAIVANGGSMPASPAALAVVGGSIHSGPTNSVVVARPALEPLTDIFALPIWLPFANVFSIGDVLIGIGVAIAIAAAMRPRSAPA